MKPRFYIIMGVSGCGKTAVGKALAQKLGWRFYDADDYHPAENIEKMSQGIPLTDEDRAPWLAALHSLIYSALQQGQPGVLACSALTQKYRQVLMIDNLGIQLVYLKGSYELIWFRMQARLGHYMQPSMLKSQFEILEEPDDALTIDIAQSVDEIVDVILAAR